MSAGSLARAAQLPKTGAAGLQAAASCDRSVSRDDAAKARSVPQQQLTYADVQDMLGTCRVDRAMAALDAMQKGAEQACAQSAWMFEYLELVTLFLPHTSDIKQGKAELLYPRVQAWKAARRDMADSLTWAVSRTRAQLVVIRETWESKLQAFFDRGIGVEKKKLPVEAHALVKGYADGFGSLERSILKMQERVSGFVRGAKAHRKCMAATTYALIRMVRC